MTDSGTPLGRTMEATRLTELPTELLRGICQLLCLHCRSTHMVDLDRNVISEARHDQRALAHLASTCRRFREIAQPILFHWYHSGYLPFKSTSDAWEEHPDIASHDGAANDALSPYLRSVVDQPTLGAAARAFTLLTSDFRSVVAKEHWGDYRDIDFNWVDCAAPQLVANMTQCFILCRRGPVVFDFLRDSPVRFSRLTYLALSPWPGYGSYDLLDLSCLLACIPDLKVLIAPDCGAQFSWDQHPLPQGRSWEVQLDKLRSVSVSDMCPEILRAFLHCCPALEDFEVFCALDAEYPQPTLRHFEDVKETLRRFCYSVTHPMIQDGTWNEYRDFVEGVDREVELDIADTLTMYGIRATGFLFDPPGEQGVRKPLAPFDASGFSHLEILEIEQILLHGPVFGRETRAEAFAASAHSGPATFLSRLPPSLRVLHVGMVVAWPELRRDLAGLAAAAGVRFPHLHTVRVDVFQDQCLGPLPEDEVEEMKGLLGGAGVAFFVGRTPEGSSPRGMLGPRPGCPEDWRVLPVLYGLDGKIKT